MPGPRRWRQGRRSLILRLLFSLVIFVAVAAAGELVARQVDLEGPTWNGRGGGTAVIMARHPSRLWTMAPGIRPNAGVPSTINTDGLRGPLPDLPRPKGRERILITGDSSFFGHGVGDGETLGVQLGEQLVQRGLDVDVVNGAIPGYSTAQTLLLLDELGWAYEPTLLVVGNLWSDNNFDAFKDADLLRTAEVNNRPWLGQFALFRLLSALSDQWRDGDTGRMVTWTRSAAWPSTGTRRVPIQDYAINLDTIMRSAAERGIGVALIAPTNVGLVEGRYRDGGHWDVYFEVQSQLARRHHVPLLRALPVLQAAGEGRALFVDEMHPSARGNARLGVAFAEALIEAGWPEKRLIANGFPVDASGLVDGPVEKFGLPPPLPNSPQFQLFEGARQLRSLEGTVSGGTAPYRMDFLNADGVLLERTELAAAGSFRVQVLTGAEGVAVRVEDATGAQLRADARPGVEPLVVVLP